MVENGQDIPLPVVDFVVDIVDITKVTHNGRVFGPVFLKEVEDTATGKKVDMPVVNPVSTPVRQSELSKESKNHNLALHILMNFKEDALSNVLVDTGSSFPKSTMSSLSYQGAPMRYIGVIIKVFDGSCKTVIGEVDLPIKIGLSDFQITFQVKDIHLAYSCLLGRSWIHEAGAMTSTLH
ncbi:uncharacterized protein LOC127095538 [Lathyrus oleraceus]|uniref:uncharacterized protein LOC127095538 n=1 Tax=Pisum sativum TaxID=3888 RepID=UPI0021CE9C18|nr:uncharacterized protein LOC127095538 [Pisum sativum]